MIHNRKREFDTFDRMVSPESFYKEICYRVVLQAYDDYKNFTKKFFSLDNHIDSEKIFDEIIRIEKFFSSAWFDFLFSSFNFDITPKEFFSKIKKIFFLKRRNIFMKQVENKVKDNLTENSLFVMSESEILTFGYSLINKYNVTIFEVIEKDKLTDEKAHEEAADGVVNFMKDYINLLDRRGCKLPDVLARQIPNAQTDKCVTDAAE